MAVQSPTKFVGWLADKSRMRKCIPNFREPGEGSKDIESIRICVGAPVDARF